MNEPREAELRSLIRRATGSEDATFGRDDDLVATLGLDSLGSLRLLALVEKRFQTRFPDDRLSEFRTLGRILDWIARRSEGREGEGGCGSA